MEFCALCFGFRLLLTFMHSVTGRIPIHFPCRRAEYFQLQQLNCSITERPGAWADGIRQILFSDWQPWQSMGIL